MFGCPGSLNVVATAPVHSHATGGARELSAPPMPECWRAAGEVSEVAGGLISTLINDHLMIRGSSHLR